MIFSNAQVKHIALARILIFGILLIDLMVDNLVFNALWGLENFHSHGLIKFFPEDTLSFLLSHNGLQIFEWVYASFLLLGLLGLGPPLIVTLFAIICTFWFHGLARGFGGHVNHQELIMFHALFFIYPSLSFSQYSFNQWLSKSKELPNAEADLKSMLFLRILTFWVLLTYFYIGIARLTTSDIRGYFTNTMIEYVAVHSNKWNYWDISLGSDILNQTWLAWGLSIGFFFATLLELSAPLALFIRKFTLFLVISLFLFHIAIWFTMNIFFWQNLLLLFLPILGLFADKKKVLPKEGMIVFYDSKCGLCDGFIQWISKNDTHSLFKFAPLKGKTASIHNISIHSDAKEWTIILFDGKESYTRSMAVIKILEGLPRWDFLSDLIILFPNCLRDAGYRFVARIRYKLFGTVDSCGLPKEDIRKKLMP